eukprot:g3176.t1
MDLGMLQDMMGKGGGKGAQGGGKGGAGSAPPETAKAEEVEKEEDGYVWSQQGEEVQIAFTLPKAASKKDVKVQFKQSSILVQVHGDTLLQGSLQGKVEAEGCTWCLVNSGSELNVMLTKQNEKDQWANLLKCKRFLGGSGLPEQRAERRFVRAQEMVDERQAARRDRDFDKADRMREELKEMGVRHLAGVNQQSASAKTPTDVPRRGRSGVVNNPGGKGPIEKRDGDWICRNCGKLVFATKDACFSCGTPRESQTATRSVEILQS